VPDSGESAGNDPLLGYTEIDGRRYYVRQMKSTKGSIAANRTEQDHACLLKAIKSGRVAAVAEA
jgi:hypothetical protein